ncbi:MAG: glycosyltransferase family 1 protein [Phycisphaeraceae bacterium]|nr:glycosyltransferase family 1 protein [Phycisphaeraceae bacterium]
MASPIGPTPTANSAALLSLGRGTDSWKFLSLALPALSEQPEQPGLSLLAASHLAKLGLRTCALEQLNGLSEEIRRTPQVLALSAAVGSLQNDELTQSSRWLESNLRALGDRLIGFGVSAPRRPLRAFGASDGNVITFDGEHWANFADSKSLAARSLTEHRASWREQPQAALFVAGCRTPWLFKSASGARPRERLGYRAPICIVEPDTHAFLAALSMSDCSDQLQDDHVRAFVGPSAVDLFAAYQRTRIDLRISGTVAHDAATPAAIFHRVAASVSDVLTEQQAEVPRLEQSVRALYAERDLRWWNARLRERPLRILIPTTRYSTFIQHSSRDIAGAFEAHGHEARVLIEPDGSSCFSAGAYLRAVRDFEPDLILCINFPRAALGDFLPRNLPWVCWIQDQMPHLFDARLGRSLGAFDFTVGHIVDELHDCYGYPRASSMLLPVPASERKFHAAPATSEERARFECEIAYVSHQSETPEAQHTRIVSELRANPSVDNKLLAAMEPLREAVYRHVQLPLSTLPFPDLRSTVQDSLRQSLRGEPDDRTVDLLAATYANPLADRIMRHETLMWASQVAQKNGWRFHIYGNGWSEHPAFGEFAKGPLAHEGELRLSYQCSACHLQATYHMLGHQRLSECVLSGGIPLCRLHWGELAMIVRRAYRRACGDGASFPFNESTLPVTCLPWTDAPALMDLASVLQQLGCIEHASPLASDGARKGALVEPWAVFGPDTQHSSAFDMTGRQAALFFHDQASLESRLSDLVSHRSTRERQIAIARRRIEANHTYLNAAAKILSLITRSLQKDPDRAAA